MTPATAIPASPHYRPELQGLRAVAALLVAVFHIWIGRVSGGVDVFFVVSGFLITTSLLRQVETHGQVQFLGYASNLARRLLPSAMVVLLATILLSVLWLPTTQWIDTIKAAAAALAYVQNWYLAINAIDYLAAAKDGNPYQHFWALSVQGQFYLLWPVLFALLAVAVRMTGIPLRKALPAALTCLFAASLAYSIHATAANQAFAYFNTFARVWEFSMGGLVALALPHLKTGPVSRLVAGWLGLLAILSCGIVLQVSEVFPGYAALWPTLGTVLVIIAGHTGSRFGADRLLASRPAQALGEISYALYLWHWPVLLFYLAQSGTSSPGLAGGMAVLALSLALAWLTTHWVETPLRFRLLAHRSPAFSLLLATACTLPVVATLGLWSAHTLAERERSQRVVNVPSLNYPGALAGLPGFTYRGEPRVPVYPGPFVVKDNLPASYRDDCHQQLGKGELLVCEYGRADGRQLIALVGDSHSAQWLPTLRRLAETHHWRIVNITKAGCWFSLEPREDYLEHAQACQAWNDNLMDWLLMHRPDAVMTVGTVTDGDIERMPASYLERWQRLDDHGIPVLALRDNPRHEFDPAVCVDIHGPRSRRCRTERAETLQARNPLETAALPGNVATLDLTNYFCRARECNPVIGNVLVYRDSHHLTRAYAQTLAEPLQRELLAVSPQLIDSDALERLADATS